MSTPARPASRTVLVADDDPVARHLTTRRLQAWGFAPVTASDGAEAWSVLQQADAPDIGLLNWHMPGMNGLEVCRHVRASDEVEGIYLIVLTARDAKADVIAGLEAGADDYLITPADAQELRARLLVADRVMDLRRRLDDRVHELEEALTRVRLLEGMISICAWCNKLRTEDNYWKRVEEYLGERADVSFTHGICPECAQRVEEP